MGCLLLLLPLLGRGQTNPAAFDLSAGSYTFTGFASTTSTYPASMQGHTLAATEPTSTAASPYLTAATGDAAMVGNGGGIATASVRNEGTSGISLCNSGPASIGDITVALNTTGRTTVQAAWTSRCIGNPGRVYGLQFQYRVGTSGAFTYVASTNFESVTTGTSQTYSVTLPVAVENQAVVQVRWLHAFVSGSGARTRLGVDDITISSSSAAPVAPAVTTTAPATSITAVSATLGGNVTTLGSPAPSANGVVYSTTAANAAPTLGGTGTTTVAATTTATATGTYTISATGLAASTAYSYQAYVTNSSGTVYGGVQTFTTATPSIAVGALTPGGAFSTTEGTASAAQTYTLTGTNLAGSLTVGPLAGYEFSKDGTGGSYGASLTYVPASGSVSGTVYVRLTAAATAAGSPYNGTVANASTGATTQNVAVSGTVTAPTGAVVTATPASLPLGTVALNTAGPISTYTVSGNTLGTTPITITAPAGVELSLNGFVTSAGTTLSLAPTAGTVASTTVSVRIAAAATAAAISGNITNTSGSGAAPVAVSGAVAAGATSCLTDNFNAYTGGATTASGSAATGLTFYTGAPQSGAAPNAAKFDDSGDQLTTPVLSSTASSLSFFVVGAGTDAASSLLVEGFNGAAYVTIAALSGFTTTGQTYTYNAGSTVVLAQGTYTRFRFTYTKSIGNIGFDDVAISCGAAAPAFTLATGSPSVAAPYCVGQGVAGDVAFNLPYTVSGGSFGTGNVFTAFLSDATGLFSTNKKAVGTLNAVSSGSIPVTLTQFSTPFTLTTSVNYRLRVEASTPATAGTDNGSNLAIASYLDNEATAAPALPGNSAATLSFTAPATCATNVVVTIKAGSAFGTKPLAGGSYAASTAFGSGTDLGGGQYVVYNGPATGSVSVSGLANGSQYAFGVFVTNGGLTGTTGYSNGVLRTVRPVVPATLAEVLVPQLISGRPTTGSTHTTRLPYVWRVSIGNLTAGATYKYYTAARASADAPGYGGVGIPIETKTAGAFVRGGGPSFGTSTLLADASGSYTGWFAVEPTADTRFNDGSTVFPMVVLNDGQGGNVESQFLMTTSPVTARLLAGGATQATAVRGNSFGTPSNFVLTYDNTAGTGRPLSGTYIEVAGSALALPTANYASFYTASVVGNAGAYGLLTPNANASGIQRLEQRALTDGSLVGCPATDADGTWPGGATTASPSTGTTAKVLSTGDTPFAAPTAGTISPANQQAGQTITITGTGFGATPNPVVTFTGGATATAATVNAAGTSLTVVVPATATTGPVSIATSCGPAAATTGNLTIVPLVFYTVAGATDLSLLASFTANSDGTVGLTPPSFTNAGQTFNILGTGRSFAANWTVSGAGAKVVLTANSSLIIPTGAVLSATLDQAAGSTLVIQNAAAGAITGLNQGAQDASSTIELAQTGAVYTVPTTLTYQNLALTNGSKRIPANVVVNGNLSAASTQLSGSVTNVAATNAGDYATIQLFGEFNQLAGVTYDATRSLTLHLMNLTAVQNLNGNGNTIALYRLYTASASAGAGSGPNPAALGGRLTGTGSVLQVANNVDGGLALYEATASLALDAGTTLRFAPGGGGNFFVGTLGQLKPDPAANLEFFRNTVNSYPLGTLRLAPGFTTVNNFLLNSVAAGANTLTLTSDLTVNGTATIQAGTLVIGANTLTLNGLLSNATGGFLNGSTSSNLVVGGSGAFGTLAFASGARLLNNFTMSRPGGTLTLAAPLVVSGTLALSNGIISTTATNLLTLSSAGSLTGGSATSYLDGPLARGTVPGAATVLFPVGKTGAYRPIVLNTATQTSSTTYTGEVLPGSARSTAVAAPLTRVSAVRYYRLDPAVQPTGYSGTVTLSFDTDDLVNFPADPTFVMAKRPSVAAGPWTNIGRTAATSSGAGLYKAGTLESGLISSFSEFSLASTAPASNNAANTLNPLPVELLSFDAARTPAGFVALTWATASERNSAAFEVERSTDGRSFERIARVAAQGTSTSRTAYAFRDETTRAEARAPRLYYRLRQLDADGTAAYSPVRGVDGLGTGPAFYPNPAQTVLYATAAPESRYRVLNLLGQALASGLVPTSGLAEIAVAALPPGTYLLETSTAAGRQTQKFSKE